MENLSPQPNTSGAQNVKTSGSLCSGKLISLGWPEPHELNSITSLRNAPNVRKWFLDDRPLDPAKNRTWLESGMRRPYESVLSIRWKVDNSFLGTIGWSDWDLILRTVWCGRLALDMNAIRRIKDGFPADYRGVAFDSVALLRDFSFEVMKVDVGFTYFFANNRFAEQVNRSCGLVEIAHRWRIRSNGTKIETVEMRMTRIEWESLRNQQNMKENKFFVAH